MLYRKRIRLRIAYQSLALPEQSGEFCLLVSDAIGDPLLICRARHSSSLLLQLAEIVLNDLDESFDFTKFNRVSHSITPEEEYFHTSGPTPRDCCGGVARARVVEDGRADIPISV